MIHLIYICRLTYILMPKFNVETLTRTYLLTLSFSNVRVFISLIEHQNFRLQKIFSYYEWLPTCDSILCAKIIDQHNFVIDTCMCLLRVCLPRSITKILCAFTKLNFQCIRKLTIQLNDNFVFKRNGHANKYSKDTC